MGSSMVGQMGGMGFNSAAGWVQYGYGMDAYYKSKRALKRLEKEEWAKYSQDTVPEGTEQRLNQLNQGFTGAEKSAFQEAAGKESMTAYRRGTDISGGNMAQALMAGQQASQIGEQNKFAAADARMRIDNMLKQQAIQDSLTDRKIQQQNLQTGQDLNLRIMKEQALGAAMQAGAQNVVGGLNAQGSAFSGSGPGAGEMFTKPQQQQQQSPTAGYNSKDSQNIEAMNYYDETKSKDYYNESWMGGSSGGMYA